METRWKDQMSLREIIQFAHPKGSCHSPAFFRLKILADHGPLDADGNLRGGHKGAHRVSAFELKMMIQELYEEEIRAHYKRGTVTPDEMKELLAQPGCPVGNLQHPTRFELIQQLSTFLRNVDEVEADERPLDYRDQPISFVMWQRYPSA
eukprot:gnl/Chilomastix_cuspidata/3794.p1 GENE.gnl/Chilomastix_cuspidata/3794~~gnl/Chilomastix_cuspidata/3794.p1  ORF type:complete len:150 (-),score=27.04 gnl/Chilomastix_cuspidata/3794:73-522(-)